MVPNLFINNLSIVRVPGDPLREGCNYTILNFHFDYLHPSLYRNRMVSFVYLLDDSYDIRNDRNFEVNKKNMPQSFSSKSACLPF